MTVEAGEGRSYWMDRFGATASSLCALHCAICALGPALFGVLGLGFLLNQSVELGLAVIAIVFALASVALLWRQHRSKLVLGLLVLGILGLVVSRGLEMGAGHHDHHEASQHGEVAKHETEHDEAEGDGQAEEEHHADEAKEAGSGEHHDEVHEGGLHALGAGVGVLGGLLIAVGHLLNLRRLRQHREALEA